MPSFRDMEGRDWPVKMTVSTIARVELATGINLTAIGESETDKELESPAKFFRVLCSVLEPHIQARGLTADQFGDSLDQESIEAAYLALTEAVIDFFPKSRREGMSTAFRKLVTAKTRHQEQQAKTVMDTVNSPEFDSTIEAMFAGKSLSSGDLLTSLQASSGLTQVPSASAP